MDMKASAAQASLLIVAVLVSGIIFFLYSRKSNVSTFVTVRPATAMLEQPFVHYSLGKLEYHIQWPTAPLCDFN